MNLTTDDNIVVLIMAGGVGSRLWPISTKERPKQFCYLTSHDRSMIQSIFDLSKLIVDVERIYVSTHRDYAPLVSRHLPSLSTDNVIQEPAQQGTTASLALSTIRIKLKHPNASVVVVSADCVIDGKNHFLKAIDTAVAQSRTGNHIVSVGVTPTEPHTGYGYMKCGLEIEDSCFQGISYTEKPNRNTAIRFLKEGSYIWNAGIFVWQVDVIRAAFAEYLPDVDEHLVELEKELSSESPCIVHIESIYSMLGSGAIDNSIMEKIAIDGRFSNIFVKGTFYWSDVGSYISWSEFLQKDNNKNSLSGDVTVDRDNTVSNSILISEPPYNISAAYIDNVIVSVCQNGNVLILPIHEDQNIKTIFDGKNTPFFGNEISLSENEPHQRTPTLCNVSKSKFTVCGDREIRAANLSNVEVTINKHEVRIFGNYV